MIKLNEGEHVIAEIQRHWLPLLGQSIALILFGLAPFGLEIFLYAISDSAASTISHYASHIVILEAAWILILWMAFAIAWTNHYLDVLIVTNKRVIDIDQLGLFSRDVAELSMTNVEDIRVEVNGFLAHWLKFGTLELQTAAESKSFIIRNLQHPERAQVLISEAHQEFLRNTV